MYYNSTIWFDAFLELKDAQSANLLDFPNEVSELPDYCAVSLPGRPLFSMFKTKLNKSEESDCCKNVSLLD